MGSSLAILRFSALMILTGAYAAEAPEYGTTPRAVGEQHLRDLQGILLAQSPYPNSLRPEVDAAPPFPRLANCYAAQLTPDSTEKDLDEIARYDLLIGGVWCNWADPEHQRRITEKMAALRQRNPRIVIVDFSASAPYHDTKDAAFPANGWLLQPDGRHISGWPGTEMTNLTHSDVLDFLAERSLASVRDRGFDGSFVDSMGSGFDTWACNIEHHDPYQVDADHDGQPDPRGQLDAAWTAAKTDLARRSRERLGSKPVFMANQAGDWGAPFLNGILLEDYLDQVLDAGADWDWAFSEYRRWCRQARQPNVTTLVSSSGVEPPYDAWRTLAPAARDELLERGRTRLDRMRFGLTTTLMDDGHFAYDLHTRWRGQRWWYPEYDVPLGYPRAPAVRQEDGTWRREFDGGTVVANPTALDVVVPFPDRHRDASSDRVGTRFLIPGRDGWILLPSEEAERPGTLPDPQPLLVFSGSESVVERGDRVLVRLPGLAALFDAQGRLLLLSDGRRTLAENVQVVLVRDEAWRNLGYTECSHRVTGPSTVEFSGRRCEGGVTVAYVARVEVGLSGVAVAYRFELFTDARLHTTRLQCDFPVRVFADGAFRSGDTTGRLPPDRAPQPVLAERLRDVSLTTGAGAPLAVSMSGDAALVDERHYGVNGYRLGHVPAYGEMKTGTVWTCAIRIGSPSPPR